MTVMVVVTSAEEAGPLVRWGARFARARDQRLIVLHPARGTKPQESTKLKIADAEDQHPVRVAIREAIRETRTLLWPAETGEETGEPSEEEEEEHGGEFELRTVLHPDPLDAVLGLLRTLRVSLLVVPKHERLTGDALEEDLSEQLMQQAPCETMLLRATGDTGLKCDRVLVPAAGGPHAPVALKLAEGMTRFGALVNPLYVEPVAGPDAEPVGMRQLIKILQHAGVHPDNKQIQPRVEVADNPRAGIARAVEEDYDLVIVGATEKGFVHRMLFRTVPERLLTGDQATAVAVIRRATPLRTRALEWLGRLRERYLPQLAREDRLVLFERLQSGSRFDIDFLLLMSFATAIAALGLLQNSGAIVIGAMLVAPLMMPMIGAGLALVQGNVVLVRDASRSIGIGFLTALVIGWVAGAAFEFTLPGGRLTNELLARGGPNPLDLLVAFVSGVAAAYAVARPNLSGALPGVAIAAALVPPIATVGISWATGNYANGNGAALLFGTNLVAIVLGAATIFRLMGVHGAGGERSARLWVRRMILGLVLAMLCLAVPLVNGLVETIARDRATVQVTEGLRVSLEKEVEKEAGFHFVTVQRSRSGADDLEVIVASERDPGKTLAENLSKVARTVLKRDSVNISLVTIKYEWSHTSR